MKRQTRASAYRFKCLGNSHENANLVEHCYVNTFQKGYSVVEIARAAGFKSAKYVHAVLVRNHQIPGGKRGKKSSKIVIPHELEIFLKERDLSYSQWCSGWGFAQEDAAIGIQTGAGIYMEAIRRDFPKLFKLFTGAEDAQMMDIPEFERSSVTVHFDWDGLLGCYSAEITDMGICAYGDSYGSALHNAMVQRNGSIIVSRLEKLPSLEPSLPDCPF